MKLTTYSPKGGMGSMQLDPGGTWLSVLDAEVQALINPAERRYTLAEIDHAWEVALRRAGLAPVWREPTHQAMRIELEALP